MLRREIRIFIGVRVWSAEQFVAYTVCGIPLARHENLLRISVRIGVTEEN